MSSNSEAALGFVSTPIPGGGTWTHTTRLGEFLAKAEVRFGPRQMDWTILGIEFFGEIPVVWFPGSRKHVAIRLARNARYNVNEALFQLAHETVHLLSPNGGGSALILEEGAATLFADEMMAELNIPLYAQGSYLEARDLTKSLLDIQANAIEIMRQTRPRMQDFTSDFIKSVVPTVSSTDADRLCSMFIR